MVGGLALSSLIVSVGGRGGAKVTAHAIPHMHRK